MSIYWCDVLCCFFFAMSFRIMVRVYAMRLPHLKSMGIGEHGHALYIKLLLQHILYLVALNLMDLQS